MAQHVALYARISIDRNGRKEGVKAQANWGRHYASQAWPDMPVRVYSDNDLSAARDDVERPDYDKLREAIRNGEVAHVWAVEQSRLERREVEWFQLAAEFDAAGISELHTNRDGVVRVRDEVAGIKAVLNAGEVRKLKRRINDRLDTIAAEGRPVGSAVFGYRYATDETGGNTLEPIPEQADAVRQAAERVLAGWSLANLARDLTARGFTGSHGGTLTGPQVRKILTSAMIAGYRMHRGRIVGRGNWQPILDEDTWHEVKTKLSTPRRVSRSDGGTYPISDAHRGNAGRRYAITGLAVCGECDAPLVGSMKQFKRRANGHRPVAPYLVCHPNRGGRGCVGIMLEPTERHVLDTLFAELDRPEFLQQIAADEHAEQREAIAAKLRGIERQRGELAELWAQPGQLSMAEWQTARNGLAENERQLRAELAEVPPPVANVDIAGAREAWPDMTLDEQREFLRLFIERATVHRRQPGTPSRFNPDRIQITWRQR